MTFNEWYYKDIGRKHQDEYKFRLLVGWNIKWC